MDSNFLILVIVIKIVLSLIKILILVTIYKHRKQIITKLKSIFRGKHDANKLGRN